MKKMEGNTSTCIACFLFQYRITPGQLPAELLMGYCPRSMPNRIKCYQMWVQERKHCQEQMIKRLSNTPSKIVTPGIQDFNRSYEVAYIHVHV